MDVRDNGTGLQQLVWKADSSQEAHIPSSGHSSPGPVLHSLGGSSLGTPAPRAYCYIIRDFELGLPWSAVKGPQLVKDKPNSIIAWASLQRLRRRVSIHCLGNNHNSTHHPEIQNTWPSQYTFFTPAYTGPLPGPSAPDTQPLRYVQCKRRIQVSHVRTNASFLLLLYVNRAPFLFKLHQHFTL